MEIEEAKSKLTRESFLLSLLQVLEYPASESRLIKYLEEECHLKTSKMKLKEVIKNLSLRGYDIRQVIRQKEPLYYLARTASYDGPYFRVQGKIKLPFLLTGDWHIGSLGWSELAFNKLLEDLDTYKIRTILHTGDLNQSLRVYPKESKDLVLHDTDSQIELAIDYLKELPKRTTMHIVMGGHEETLKGYRQIGFDILKYIANAIPNLNYYGDIMLLEFKNKYKLLGLHSSGKSTIITSTKADRIWNNLEDRPDILAIGHNHRLYDISKGNKLVIETGSLQRETNLVLQRGTVSRLGWYILEDYNDTTAKLIRRIPEIY